MRGCVGKTDFEKIREKAFLLANSRQRYVGKRKKDLSGDLRENKNFGKARDILTMLLFFDCVRELCVRKAKIWSESVSKNTTLRKKKIPTGWWFRDGERVGELAFFGLLQRTKKKGGFFAFFQQA